MKDMSGKGAVIVSVLSAAWAEQLWGLASAFTTLRPSCSRCLGLNE